MDDGFFEPLFDLEPYTVPVFPTDGNETNVPDALWATDNEWDIPVLDVQMQAFALDMPFAAWGSKMSRFVKRHGGTCHFYTDDYRFEKLWDNPAPVVDAGFINAVEPNFTVIDDLPTAIAVYHIYRKRWMARWWQSRGVRVFVDLNVDPRYRELNLRGVPDGWKAFATRGYSDCLDLLEIDYKIAVEKSQGETPLFVVYGGGKAVRAAAMALKVIWVPDQRDEWKARWENGA